MKKDLDEIIEEMIDAVENSQVEISNISQESHKEYEKLEMELSATKKMVMKFIATEEKLAREVRQSRKKLSLVSQKFNEYTGDDIQRVYEETHQLQTRYLMIQREEKALREKRDDLERRILVLAETIDRSEVLVDKMSVILPYLNNDFRRVNDLIADAKGRSEFSLKIINAQEEERKRISREIHDGPAQMMANIFLRSEIIERAIQNQTYVKASSEIQDVRKMIGESLREVRRIIYDLRPMALDDLGLIPTVRKYIFNMKEYSDMNIQFIPLGKEKRIEQKYEITLFRIMQEALQNALKHSEAKQITVKLELGEDNLSLVVKDDGVGFDTGLAREKNFGLVGMKERAEMLDGKINIQSNEGKGTRIHVNIPYYEMNDA